MYFYTGHNQGENTLEDTLQRNLTFPFLLNERENCFLLKGLYPMNSKIFGSGKYASSKNAPTPPWKIAVLENTRFPLRNVLWVFGNWKFWPEVKFVFIQFIFLIINNNLFILYWTPAVAERVSYKIRFLRPSLLPSILPSLSAFSWNCVISFF